jgi:hypothetical protein
MVWTDFFVAQVGASASLAGLLFVGVSLNMSKILASRGLPERALGALVLLVTILIVASLELVPGQSEAVLGVEIVAVGLVAWAATTVSDVKAIRVTEKNYQRLYFNSAALNQVAVVPYLIGGTLVATGYVNGIYFIVPAMLVSFVKAIMEAWVLLVEVNR